MKSPPRTLLLVLALLLLPFATAAGLYALGWHPQQPANQGELLAPPRALPALSGIDGQALPPSAFAGQWHIVVAGSGPCDAACTQWLTHTRQVHVALYQQMPRVHRAWLSAPPGLASRFAPLQRMQPDLRAFVATDAAARQAFDLDQAGYRVFVIDPMGQIILRYPPDADPRGLLKDMERLLRYAWAG